MELANPVFPRDTLITPMIMMVENGVPMRSFIDVGAADGSEESQCHSACPLSRGCQMSRCPRCGYEFASDGRVARLLTNLFHRRSHDSRTS